MVQPRMPSVYVVGIKYHSIGYSLRMRSTMEQLACKLRLCPRVALVEVKAIQLDFVNEMRGTHARHAR